MHVMTDAICQELGFADAREFHSMVAAVDITTPEKRRAFALWQEDDGTKEGLSKLAVASEGKA